MGRLKIHDNRRAVYEAKNPGRKHGKSGKSGRTKTKAHDGFFVAWDGEGKDFADLIDLPESLQQQRENYIDDKSDLSGEGFDTQAHSHGMTLFACYGADNYASISDGQALSSESLLSFIGDSVQKFGGQAIHVSFSFSYDATHILRELPREEIIKAHSSERKTIEDYGRYGPYLIKYRPRKELYIAELENPAEPYKRLSNGKRILDKKWSVTIWDVWGFFQSSFIKALSNWSIGTPEALELIKSGKDGRSDFASWDSEDIERYNHLELVLLCELMDQVRNATNALNLPLARWDGAGAVAAAMYKKELEKDYIKTIVLPKEVERAAYYAYAGGRSECIKQGNYDSTLYRYDINSAYPDAMRTIPDLSDGSWIYIKDSYFAGLQDMYQGLYIENFALYHISWYDDTGEFSKAPFLPFFHRDVSGTIYFPPFGENWVWGIELAAAMRHASHLDIAIHGAYVFKPHNSRKPFQFIERYYNERLAIKQRIKADESLSGDNGRSLIIKLGLNSLYGKTVQKVGIEQLDDGSINYPPYYNIAIGSYITAYTRAKLYERAMLAPHSICLFATDGILSTAPLGSTESSEALGDWECEQLEGLTLLQAGVYWTKKYGVWSEKSRGIDKAQSQEEVNERRKQVLSYWKLKIHFMTVSLRRFITAKWASLTEERYPLRGVWLNQRKQIEVFECGKKRINNDTQKRHTDLITTYVNHSPCFARNQVQMSEPRRIDGIDYDSMLEGEYDE